MDLKFCEDPSIYEENKYTCLRDYFFNHSRSEFYRICIFLNQCGLRSKIEDSENHPQSTESIKTVSFSLGAFLVAVIVITILLSFIIRICLIRKMSRTTQRLRARNSHRNYEPTSPEETIEQGQPTQRFRARNPHRNSMPTNPEEENIDQGPPTYADTVLSDDELPNYEDSLRSEPCSIRKLHKGDEKD